MNGKFKKTGFDDDQFARLTPGQRLAAAREARGLSIEDVVRHTKLSRRQVMALESDAHDQLPGPVFVRGFMRNYARHLQLDPAPLLATLDAKSAPAVIPSGDVVEPADLRRGAGQPLSVRVSEASSAPASDSSRDSSGNAIAEPVIEQGRAEPVTVEQGTEPGMRQVSDAAPEPARTAQDAQDAAAVASDARKQPESASTHTSTRVAAAKSNAIDAAATDETRPNSVGESIDTLDGIADTSVAWRNYALVSLAVVIGLLALVIATQT
ncbi:MAG: helix-turn-helix domain-containing protein [Burkholderiales bacterium]|nr:helix-turn-helix domain-containing protein [Burkholderiales bacterium]